VRGVVLDIISRISQHLDRPRSHLSFDYFKQCEEFSADLIGYPTGEDLRDVFWCTLIGNMSRDHCVHERKMLGAPKTHAELYGLWRADILPPQQYSRVSTTTLPKVSPVILWFTDILAQSPFEVIPNLKFSHHDQSFKPTCPVSSFFTTTAYTKALQLGLLQIVSCVSQIYKNQNNLHKYQHRAKCQPTLNTKHYETKQPKIHALD
jgi:hypothetical protein